ncbi:hypothetical protein CYMTET_48564, partial [Cymbomonas tetramitiformis]
APALQVSRLLIGGAPRAYRLHSATQTGFPGRTTRPIGAGATLATRTLTLLACGKWRAGAFMARPQSGSWPKSCADLF